ncbi:MAG TPA: hypothetical protein PLX35_10225 [Cyclobacteriaceae bacterium]|nr:hypothetical protein [Cyclobacteriaceae bacterium]
MRLFLLILIAGVCFLIYACANDNLESLAAKSNVVVKDTTNTTTSNSTTTTTTTTDTGTGGETTVSFSKDIQPILSTYRCANCHGSGYYNYIGVSSLARSGQLLGTMSWAAGFRKMPPNQKASASELALISTWIKEGTLNN